MVDFAFLDSGTGGIPYMIDLLKHCPSARCVYIGDTKHFPYGQKSHEEIVHYVLEITQKIIENFKPLVIVIACNTMSVNALDVLREVYPNQAFVGTVPAIKLAATVSKNKKIGLLATASTVNSPYNIDLKNHFAVDCDLVLRADPELISFIEHESFTATKEERENACKNCVNFFLENGCDVIILGCTHFLNMKEDIQKVCGDSIKVVDSVDGVTKRALSLIGQQALRAAFEPAEGGAKHTTANTVSEECGAWGKAFPTKLFITGLYDKNDEKEYDVICKKYNICFGGNL